MALRSQPALLWWGIGLIVVGVIGSAVLFISSGPAGTDLFLPFGSVSVQLDEDAYDSVGERVFLTGRDSDGRLIPRSGGFGGMMRAAACADCHGRDGAGRVIGMMMFDIEAPDIRWTALTEEESGEANHAHEPYDLDGFARALREGVAPGGERLDPVMPRWGLSDSQVEALAEYLQQLSD